MYNKTESNLNSSATWGSVVGWAFGILTMAIGLINTFWGNDPGYGVFIFLVSFIFIPSINMLFKKITGLTVPLSIKIIAGFFVLWTALGVAELFDKIQLMINDF